MTPDATREGVDVMCRYARMAAQRPDLFHHVCRRRDGRLVRPLLDDCWHECHAQVREMRPQPDGGAS